MKYSFKNRTQTAHIKLRQLFIDALITSIKPEVTSDIQINFFCIAWYNAVND